MSCFFRRRFVQLGTPAPRPRYRTRRRAAPGFLGYQPRARVPRASTPPPLANDGFYDRRIVKECIGRQIGENLSFRQRDDSIGMRSDKVHVVLDKHDALDAGLE